jgi:hypothetical protein
VFACPVRDKESRAVLNEARGFAVGQCRLFAADFGRTRWFSQERRNIFRKAAG